VNLLENHINHQMLVVGVGNPMRGDDEAGLILAEKVAAKLDLEYLRCEEIPENYVGERAGRQRHLHPQLLGGAAGEGAGGSQG